MRNGRRFTAEESANGPVWSGYARRWNALRGHGLALARLLLALPLMFGLLSVPVSCAMAAGPHSLFVAPSSTTNFVIHIHGRLTGASTGVTVEIEPAGVCPNPAKARPLPNPVTSVSALVAVLAPEPLAEPAPAPSSLLVAFARPLGVDPASLAPPPRL